MNLSQTLPALYVINKHAKKFANEARRSYKSRSHTDADINSNRKKALYDLKHQALLQIHPEADKIEKHKIDGSYYYHLEFEDGSSNWEFHIPVEKLSIDKRQITETKTLTSFTKDSTVSGVNMSLKQALNQIYDELGLNANDFLPPGAQEAEWTYLYGAY